MLCATTSEFINYSPCCMSLFQSNQPQQASIESLVAINSSNSIFNGHIAIIAASAPA